MVLKYRTFVQNAVGPPECCGPNGAGERPLVESEYGKEKNERRT